MALTPIILFIYNRPNHTKQTLEALSNNTLASQSDLFIFADGPKNTASKEQLESIKQTRKVAASENWCKSVTLIESETNKGLARSIIEGVTEIINKYGKAIILEDDIITGKYFLEYMNEALEKYQGNKEVWHVTGWRDPIKHTKKNKAYFYPTMDCWSWATWADRWQNYKKDATYYKSIFTDSMKKAFNIDGADPYMWLQIEENISGKINTWAIFWYATIFLKHGLCIAPTTSLCKNIGFDNSGVHCSENQAQTIETSIDYKITNFPKRVHINTLEYKRNKNFLRKIKYKQKIDIVYDIKCLIPLPLKNCIKKILKKISTS